MNQDILKLLTEADRLKARVAWLQKQAYEADCMAPTMEVAQLEAEAQCYTGKAGRLANKLLQAAVEALAAEIDYPLTWGYIGNCGTHTGALADDRGWCIFAPHPGRIGTFEDHLACGKSDDLPRALELFENGMVKAWALSHKSEEIK